MPGSGGSEGQIGIGKETTYNVFTVPTMFQEFTSESVKFERERIESEGIRKRRTLHRWALGVQRANGDIEVELPNVGAIGLLLGTALGSYTFTLNSPQSGVNSHVFTPGPVKGKNLSIQVGRPSTAAGVVQTHSYTGCKLTDWEISAATNEYAKMTASIYGAQEWTNRQVTDGVTTTGTPNITSATAAFDKVLDTGKPISGTNIPAGTTILSVQSATAATLSANATATGSALTFQIGPALTTATYPASLSPFVFTQAAITIGGSSYPLKEITVSGAMNLETDLHRMTGTGHIPNESEESGLKEVTFEATSDYIDLTQYQRYLAGSEATVSVKFTGAQSPAHTLEIVGNARFDGETPEIGGRELLEMTVTGKFFHATSDASAITVTLVNDDATYGWV